VSETSTAVLPSAAHSACERALVSSLASGGNASSTSAIFVTGLKTWQGGEALGRPLSAPSCSADRLEVGRGEDRPGVEDLGQLGEQRGLRGVLLDDRLDT
jgi:hypothetical protein